MKYALALLADIANGIFAMLLAAHLTQTELLWWHLLLGIGFAMCPDLDALPELIKRHKLAASAAYAHDHRSGFHFPLLFLIVGAVAVYVAPFFGTLFLIATMLHFVNDLYGTGWGIPVLWPLRNTRYKLLARRANRMKSMLAHDGDWNVLPDAERRLRLVASWEEAELPLYLRRWGIEDWVDHYYLKLNWISVTEYTLFVVAVLLLVVLW
ncbi:MAG: hypothetical protein RL150_689 [Candidatus Parcubacteria bacterium]|jgi:hypothetical protein